MLRSTQDRESTFGRNRFAAEDGKNGVEYSLIYSVLKRWNAIENNFPFPDVAINKSLVGRLIDVKAKRRAFFVGQRERRTE